MPRRNCLPWLLTLTMVLLRAFAVLEAWRPAPMRRPARRLGRSLAGLWLRCRARHRFVGHEGDGGAVVGDVERGAPKQRVTGLPVAHLDPDPAPPEEEAEGQAGEPLREPGGK